MTSKFPVLRYHNTSHVAQHKHLHACNQTCWYKSGCWMSRFVLNRSYWTTTDGECKGGSLLPDGGLLAPSVSISLMCAPADLCSLHLHTTQVIRWLHPGQPGGRSVRLSACNGSLIVEALPACDFEGRFQIVALVTRLLQLAAKIVDLLHQWYTFLQRTLCKYWHKKGWSVFTRKTNGQPLEKECLTCMIMKSLAHVFFHSVAMLYSRGTRWLAGLHCLVCRGCLHGNRTQERAAETQTL